MEELPVEMSSTANDLKSVFFPGTLGENNPKPLVFTSTHHASGRKLNYFIQI